MRALCWSLLGFALVGLTACSHYRLGTESAPRFETLHVAIVKSDALLPQANALLTTQIREAFIKDGRVKLVSSQAEADATLSVRIENFRREAAVSRADDTGLARRFDDLLSVRLDLQDNRTAKSFFSARPIVARRGAFTDNGQLQSEYQVLPLLTEKIANDTVRAVLDTW